MSACLMWSGRRLLQPRIGSKAVPSKRARELILGKRRQCRENADTLYLSLEQTELPVSAVCI